MQFTHRSLNILFVSDKLEHCLPVIAFFRNEKIIVDFEIANSLSQISQCLDDAIDLIISDHEMVSIPKNHLFEYLHNLSKRIPVVIVCDNVNEIASRALMMGAIDCVARDDHEGLYNKVSSLAKTRSKRQTVDDFLAMCNNFELPVFVCNEKLRILASNTQADMFYIQGIKRLETPFIELLHTKIHPDILARFASIRFDKFLEKSDIGSIAFPVRFQRFERSSYKIELHHLGGIEKLFALLILDITPDAHLYAQSNKKLIRVQEDFEQKEGLQNLRLIQNKQYLNRRSNLFSQLSHEIRTPMNAIAGYAETLVRRELDEDTHQIAKRIARASNLLLGVVNDILDFSKIESDQMVLANEPFILGDVVDDVASIMSNLAKAKQLELSIKTPDIRHFILKGDSLRIRQILINLTANAVKFTSSGSVSLVVTELTNDSHLITYRFAVNDTGIGISQDVQNVIMNPFVQANTDISHRYGGSGLGLYICRNLIERMGGELLLSSELGKGSRFYFDLVLPILSKQKDSSKVLKETTVLICDDNSMSLDAMATTVLSLGCRVFKFLEGQRLLKWLDDNPSMHNNQCVVLIDWAMPVMDGPSLVKSIQQKFPQGSRPLLYIVTSRDLNNDSEKAQLNINGLFDKPLAPGIFYDAIMHAHEHTLKSEPAIHLPRLSNLNILVVEDAEMNAELITLLLTEEGAKVTIAKDGQTCRQYLTSNQHFDLILMDIQLPDIDGYTLTKELVNKNLVINTPVIAMSARDGQSDKQLAQKAGMEGWISKPINIESAVVIILTALQKDQESAQDMLWQHNAKPKLAGSLSIMNLESPSLVYKNEKMLSQVMSKFVDLYTPVLKQLQSKELDDQSLQSVTHKMLGSAASLGLEKLASVCNKYETYYAGLSDYLPEIEQLIEVLGLSLTAAKENISAVEPSVSDNTAQISSQKLQEIIKQGELAFSLHDINQVEVFMSLLKSYQLSDLYKKLQPEIAIYDFKKAKDILRQINTENRSNNEEPLS